jgi:hypothetical protein
MYQKKQLISILFLFVLILLIVYFFYKIYVITKSENYENLNHLKFNNNKLKIVINSYIDNDISLNKLILSLKQSNNFSKHKVYVFIGGYYNQNKKYNILDIDDNITYISCNNNSIDFTGLIGIQEFFSLNNNEYYFYMHDTCVVGKNFINNLDKINLNNATTLCLKNFPSMNIGVYSNKIIHNFKDTLMELKNTDPNKSQEFKKKGVEKEDIIFKMDKNNKLINNKDHFISSSGPYDYYNTGVLRLVEYYDLDLYKLKANWEKKENYELKI